jgi:hypothetical protein
MRCTVGQLRWKASMAAPMSADRSSKLHAAAGVTHAAMVEAHRRITGAGETPGEQQELAVTPDPVLRDRRRRSARRSSAVTARSGALAPFPGATDARCCSAEAATCLPWPGNDRRQEIAGTREEQGLFDDVHAGTASDIARRLASSSAGHSLISVVCQKAGPLTAVPRASWPAACHCVSRAVAAGDRLASGRPEISIHSTRPERCGSSSSACSRPAQARTRAGSRRSRRLLPAGAGHAGAP